MKLGQLSLALEAPGFDYASEFGYSVDYEWDSEGQLMYFEEFDPYENSEDSGDDSDISS